MESAERTASSTRETARREENSNEHASARGMHGIERLRIESEQQPDRYCHGGSSRWRRRFRTDRRQHGGDCQWRRSGRTDRPRNREEGQIGRDPSLLPRGVLPPLFPRRKPGSFCTAFTARNYFAMAPGWIGSSGRNNTPTRTKRAGGGLVKSEWRRTV